MQQSWKTTWSGIAKYAALAGVVVPTLDAEWYVWVGFSLYVIFGLVQSFVAKDKPAAEPLVTAPGTPARSVDA